MPVAVGRLRVPATYAGLALMTLSVALMLASLADAPTLRWGHGVLVVGAVIFAVAFVLTVASPRARVPEVTLARPVMGTWTAVHSPASRVPSLGTHAWGQTFALSLVYDPPGIARPGFADGTGTFLGPGRFPGYGQPVLAPAHGQVVHVTDGARDHRSRSNRRAYVWMVCEGAVRQLLGPRAIFGNHVVIRLEDGSHVLLAHLRRGSIRVREGQWVDPGHVLGACGNSGNSAQPHVLMQRQDVASPYVAVGLPWRLAHAVTPANGNVLHL